MKVVLCLLLSLVFSINVFGEDDVVPGYNLYRARVEAETCSLQVQMAKASIEKHFMGVPSDTEICFDMGMLYSYIKDLDLAASLAYEDLKNEPWELRYYFHLPFQERDNLMGACITSDPTMPVGDFKELDRRLTRMDEILRKLF